MRKYLLAAVAAVAIASPAAARDNAWYVGVEGGLMVVEDTNFEYEDADVQSDEGLIIDHNTGFDADLIGGYDFGMFRVEAEAGYKRASLDEFRSDLVPEVASEADGHVSVVSAMVNGLLDFSDDSGWSGYVGPGIGVARVKYVFESPLSDDPDDSFKFSDSGLAWQVIAGVRKHVNPSTELGLKYRFFNSSSVSASGDDGFNGGEPFDLDGKFRSHSLLASLIFNFLPPAPPPVVIVPPPPPMAPATQTCPDGTVILATEVCPLPPPPPPPPPAGERG